MYYSLETRMCLTRTIASLLATRNNESKLLNDNIGVAVTTMLFPVVKIIIHEFVITVYIII